MNRPGRFRTGRCLGGRALLVVFTTMMGAEARTAQTIPRAHFRKDVPLLRHGAFFGKAALALCRALVLPALFAQRLGLE